MKHFIISILLFSALGAQAQSGGNRQEKVEALYVAYMTRELNLTEGDAQKFWPVHGQYENEVRALKGESNEIERQQSVLNIKKKYQERFIKILGAERTNNFFVKDEAFRKKLVDRLKNMRQQNQPQRQRNPQAQQ